MLNLKMTPVFSYLSENILKSGVHAQETVIMLNICVEIYLTLFYKIQ